MNSFFGTDGIRACMGTGLFTSENLPLIAQAISTWINNTYARAEQKPQILIIHDTRNSCAYIKSLIKTIFLSKSIDVYDAGVLPTPAASYLIKKYGYDCALIISASHNKWTDNGIKIINKSGKLSPQAELDITKYIQEPVSPKINYHNLGHEYLLDGVTEYFNALIPFFRSHFLQGQKIVLDCAHGSTSVIASSIFKHFGAEVITINCQPDGFNINNSCGSTAPELLQKYVLEHGADSGFAFDGDGDRIIAVNRLGIIKNGDDILALLSQHPDYIEQKVIVGTLMSNMGLDSWLKKQNKELIRTSVGDKYVAQALDEHHLTLGGEQSGHIILKNYTHTGDGLLVALKTIEVAILLKNRDLETFTPYPQVLLTIPVKRICDLNEDPYNKLIEYAQQRIPQGRVSVRYSGTEKNMLRIMVESELLDDAHTLANILADSLQKELS